jgi:predicted Zn-dependent peptidase
MLLRRQNRFNKNNIEFENNIMRIHKHILHQAVLRAGMVFVSAVLVLAVSVTSSSSHTAPTTAPAYLNNVGQSARTASDAGSLVSEFDVNGMKLLVKRRPGSQTVAAGLFIRGGSLNINAENAGIETLMLDVASESSQNFPRERLRTELASMGSSITFGINSDYSVLSLASTRGNFDRSWEMFADVAIRPSFAADDFARVKSREITALQGQDDVPDSLLQEVQARAAYVGHPYLNDTHGTVESIGRLTLEDVRRYHQQIMQTSRLLLVIVGDLDPQQLEKKVTASFGKLTRGNYHQATIPQLSFTSPTVDVTPRQLPTNYVQGIFSAPSLTSPDIYAMRIASAILRDRVFNEVRVKRNLSYAPNAFLSSQGANTGGIYVTAVDANQAVKVMLNEIGRLQREQISSEDIKGVAQQYLTEYYLGQETNAAQAGELAMYELIGGGWRNSLVYLDRLRAVTPDDVQRVSKAYMRNLHFVVIGNPNSVDKAIFTAQTGD